MIHENIELTGSLEVSGSFILPLGGDSDREDSPITGSLFYNTASRKIEVYNGTAWVTQSLGGSGGDTPAADTSVEYLVVAGGGGGGRTVGGGGGAGGYLSSSFASLTSGSSYTITVGAGGAGGSGGSGEVDSGGDDGSDSSISGTGITTVTATGGGGGGSMNFSGAPYPVIAGRDGGSGGGSSNYDGSNTSNVVAGGSGTTGQGNDGGDSTTRSAGSLQGGAGGGGASAAGTNATSTAGGNGGNGLASSITGTSTTRGGGGAGAGGTTQGTAGTGGGGAAGASSNNGTAGTANTGGGGGGSYNNAAGNGGSGGSGVVILAYNSGSIHGAGGISGDAGNGRRYHQFNSSDSFVVGSTSDFNIVTGSLVAHYDAGDFSSRGTSTWTDLEGSYNGTVSGATLTNFYYDFDGSNDWIDLNDGGDLKSTSNITICAWINAEDDSTYKTIVGNFNSAASQRGYSFQITNTDQLELNWYSSNNSNHYRQYRVNDFSSYLGEWVHVAVTITNDTTGAIYINGVNQTISTAQGPGYTSGASHTTTTDTSIGALNNGAAGFFDGEIGLVQIYDGYLTAAEILQNYNATKTNFV